MFFSCGRGGQDRRYLNLQLNEVHVIQPSLKSYGCASFMPCGLGNVLLESAI
jgi:hypothetical protein